MTDAAPAAHPDALAATLGALAELRALADHAELVSRHAGELRDAAAAAAERIAARRRAAGGVPAELPPAFHTHRPGRRPTLATDPELRAFVEARFGRMTFGEIADAAEAHFGERRLGRSAIHDWWKKNFARAK